MLHKFPTMFKWQCQFHYCPKCVCFFLCFFCFFFKFYFIFKLYITVLDLPNIKMNPPQVSVFESESESHSDVSYSWQPHGLYSPWNSSGQNTGVGSLFLLQWIFPTQGSNTGLLHCRQILALQWKLKGILEWVAYPFSSGSS